MGKQHLKRICTPRTWALKRKEAVFITRPKPGAHALNLGMPLSVILKEVGAIETTREARKIVSYGSVFVDGKKAKDVKRIIGFMDVLHLGPTKKNYRLLLNGKGKIVAHDIDDKEAKQKVCKITGKTTLKGGKTQLNFSDARNVTVEKDTYKVGDSVVMELPKQKIVQHFPLDKGMTICLTGGKHIGSVGKVEEMQGERIIIHDTTKKRIETLKKYAFVIGKEKGVISLP